MHRLDLPTAGPREHAGAHHDDCAFSRLRNFRRNLDSLRLSVMTVLLGCIIVVSPPQWLCSVKFGMSQTARDQGFGALPRPSTNTQIIVRAISLCGAASTDGFGVVSGRLSHGIPCVAQSSRRKTGSKATSSGAIDVCTRISKRALMCLCACIGYPGRPFSRSCRKPGPDARCMHALAVRKYQACGRSNRTCSILHLACDVQGVAACTYIRTFAGS